MLVNCVICSDIFTPSSEISGTPCGHLFHYVCVTQWLERSKTCPQCRAKTTDKSLHRVYFNVSNSGGGSEDTSSLQNSLDSMSFDMRLKNMELKKTLEEKEKLAFQTSGLRKEVKSLEERLSSHSNLIGSLKSQVKFFQSESKNLEKSKNEVRILQNRVKTLENVETIINGTAEEVDDVIQSYDSSSSSYNALKTFVCVLKKEIKLLGEKRQSAQTLLASTESDLRGVSSENRSLRSEIESLETRNNLLEEDLAHMEKAKKSLESKISKLEQAILSPSDNNLQSKVLRRLIAESPAPEDAKRLKISDPTDENSTPLRHSLASPPMTEVLSISPKLKLKTSSIGIACLRTTKPSQLNIKKTGFNFKGDGSGSNKFSIFNRGRIDNPFDGGLKAASSGHAYNGLGGHSTPDVFPQPRPVGKSNLLKKARSLSAIPKSKMIAPANTPKLSSFFTLDP